MSRRVELKNRQYQYIVITYQGVPLARLPPRFIKKARFDHVGDLFFLMNSFSIIAAI